MGYALAVSILILAAVLTVFMFRPVRVELVLNLVDEDAEDEEAEKRAAWVAAERERLKDKEIWEGKERKPPK